MRKTDYVDDGDGEERDCNKEKRKGRERRKERRVSPPARNTS